MQEITVYTATFCGYCKAAKQLLNQLQLPYKEISLDGKDDLRAELSAANGGYRTVPMIFIGDQFVGGYTDLSALHQKGELVSRANS